MTTLTPTSTKKKYTHLFWLSILMVGLYLLAIYFFQSNKNFSEQNVVAVATKSDDRKIALILVGHGGIPKDFPKVREYFQLQSQGGEKFQQIKKELIYWQRNEKNDAYWAGMQKVANEAAKNKLFSSVQVAFNEFCAPLVMEALTEVAKNKPDEIILTSVMITPGGEHSEVDIPELIKIFKEENPGIKITYAWPYQPDEISEFLISHTQKFISK